ncbi:MAG: response regulator [Bacteroidota bacterium]
MKTKQQNKPLSILLADDDPDDRFFFDKALKTLPIATRFSTVENGEELMARLRSADTVLPDILFLDLNMPRKNGSECLSEIHSDETLRRLPVVIYSTSLHEDIADQLYDKGAYFYIRKTDLAELKKILLHVLTLLVQNKFTRPPRSKFIMSLAEV